MRKPFVIGLTGGIGSGKSVVLADLVSRYRQLSHMIVQEKNRREKEVLPAARGPILDTRNRLLAADEMLQSVIFDNIFLNEKKSNGALDRMAQALAKVEQRPWVEIRRAWSETDLRERYVRWVAHTIAPATGKTAEEIAAAILARKNSRGEALPWI